MSDLNRKSSFEYCNCAHHGRVLRPIGGECPACALERKKYDSERASSLASDPVNHPNHYKLFPDLEAIDVIQRSLTPEEFAGYCKGNALKYRMRAGEKGDAEQDLAKANWYRDKLRSLSGLVHN